jgi:hypothetical protein
MARRSSALDDPFHADTSAYWLNAVEGFFSAITRRGIRRGAFHAVDDLQNASTRYTDSHNSDCRPFVWTTSAKAIFEKTCPDPCTFCLSQCTSSSRAWSRGRPFASPCRNAQPRMPIMSRGPRKIAVAGGRGRLWGERHRIETGTNRNHPRANSWYLTSGGNFPRSPQVRMIDFMKLNSKRECCACRWWLHQCRQEYHREAGL